MTGSKHISRLACIPLRIHLLIVLAAISLLPGCATMNEGECRTADWYDIGLHDGLNGQTASRFHEHVKACAEFGIRPIDQRYFDGRDRGLREYCRFDNAFQTGLKGQQYHGVCPPDIDLRFRRYNETAYEVYRLRNETASERSRQEGKEQRLQEKKLTDEQRNALRQEIRDLDRKLGHLRDDLHTREQELDRLMVESQSWKRLR